MPQQKRPGERVTEPIADRVSRFFEGQIAWYGRVLEELAAVGSPLDEEGLSGVEARRVDCDREIEVQKRELEALLAEWQGARPSAAERARIRSLARRAEEAAAGAASALERASAGAGSMAAEVRRSLESLRNGRRAFSGYRQIQADTGLLDEQA
jgi:hypothetical protein